MWKRALHFHYMYCAAQHHQITSVFKINLLIKIPPNQKFIIFVNLSNLLLALNGYYNPYWNILTCELKLLWSIIVLSFLFERNQHHVMNVCQGWIESRSQPTPVTVTAKCSPNVLCASFRRRGETISEELLC